MKNKQFLIAIVAVITVITACKKDLEYDSSPARLFRPVANMPLAVDSNKILATWLQLKGVASYTIQLSKDTFKTVLRTVNLGDTGAYIFRDLEWFKQYQVQVRANASDTAYNSKWSYLGSIKTAPFPTILKTPGISDITEEAVKVSWTTDGAPVTSIKILKRSDSTVVQTVTLTPTDVTNQFRIVNGLASATGYIIYLYSGTSVRGWVDFDTKAPMTGSLIDLRGITGRPSVLSDTIPLIASGSTVILKRGETYTIASAINLSKSIKIVSGSDLSVPGQAIISMPANFNITAGSTIDYLIFEDVTLRGTDYTAKYVFNINTACNIGQMSFLSCKAEIFRGVVRTQTSTAAITNFLVDNCILDSLAGYGVLTIDVNTSKVDNIIIKNSTIYKAEKIIVSKNNSTSVLIENCTVNEAVTNSSYYVDYNTSPTNVVASGITINNCIFGIGKLTATGPATVRGVRSATAPTGSNNFRTNDQVSGGNDVPSLTTYARPVTQLFIDAANANFKIADVTFPGRSSSGDPRWRL